MSEQTIFLLSPANTSGKRALMVMSETARFELAQKLRDDDASLGEVFSFLSGLYFRGKLTYGIRFSTSAGADEGPLIITSNRGLLPATTRVRIQDLRDFGSTDIAAMNESYTVPLRRDCIRLKERLTPRCRVVLLGSIASDKYVGILREIFKDQLLFPIDFIGRGDMSRGGLMLRASSSGEELAYARLSDVQTRRGRRPPKLGAGVAS